MSVEALRFFRSPKLFYYLVGVVLISFNDIACAYTFMEHFHFQTSNSVIVVVKRRAKFGFMGLTKTIT